MLPSVRVRRRGDVITVEQRVPARVESIQTRSSYDSARRGYVEHHDIPSFESGLGSPTSAPLVKERLTVPASAVSEQQVRQAVDHTIAAYDPGTAALSVQLSGDALLRLLQTVFLLGMAGFGLYFIVHPLLSKYLKRASRRSFRRFAEALDSLPPVSSFS